MNPKLRQIGLSAVAAAALGISVWHFVPASPTRSLVADLPAHGEVDAPTPGPFSLSPSELTPTRDVSSTEAAEPSAPPRPSLDAGAPPIATLPREALASSVGAIKVQSPNRSRFGNVQDSGNLVAEAPRRRLIIEVVPPSAPAGHAAIAGAAPTAELQIDLAPGVKEPIAMVDSAADLAPAQARALAGIANEFVERIEKAADTFSDEEFTATWAKEQADADAQYLAIFGAEAYHQKLAETAANALAGKPVERDAAATK